MLGYSSILRAAPVVRGRSLALATVALLAGALVTAVSGAGASTRYPARVAQTCASANTRAVGPPTPAMRTAVVCLINAQRTAHHLPALLDQPRLDLSAQGWTNHMIASGVVSHGSDFSARLTAAGFIWSSAGENIASGYTTPSSVVNAWMGSTGHCQNILAPDYADVGTGIGRGVRGSRPGSATWTQDFGLRRGQRAPSGNFGPANGCPY